MADNFLYVCTGSREDIQTSISMAYKEKIEKNRASLESIIDVILTLAKRNIALRGNWDTETHEEDGNFQFFVNWKSGFDTVMREHLQTHSSSKRQISLSQNTK